MVTNFEGLQKKNFRRSLLLVATLFLVLTALVYMLGAFFGGVSSGSLTVFAVLFSAGSAGLSWWQSDRLVLAMTKARIVEAHEVPQLHNVVEEVAIAAGLPKPRVAIVDDPAPNAFATGRTPERAIVAVTTGLIAQMDRDELQAVVAHEMAHVANRDTLVMSVAAATAGVIALIGDLAFRFTLGSRGSSRNRQGGSSSLMFLPVLILAPFAAGLLKAAISRSREGLADATAVEFTRNPAALRSALGKLAADSTVVRARSASVAHLWIECPLDGSSALNRLYSTHPPIADRIAALWRLEGGAGAPPSTPGYAPDPRTVEGSVRGFGLLVGAGVLLAMGLSVGVYGKAAAVFGQLCMAAAPVLWFLAYRRLRSTPAGARWAPLALLALLVSGAIVAQYLGLFGVSAAGIAFLILLARSRSRTGRTAPQNPPDDIRASAIHTLDVGDAASSPTPGAVGADLSKGAPVGRTELAWNFRRIKARPEPTSDLEAWASAASAKWVKWAIGIFVAMLVLPLPLMVLGSVMKCVLLRSCD